MSFCHLNGFLLFWINIFRNCIIELSATMLFISLRTNKSERKLNKIKNEDVIRMIRCFFFRHLLFSVVAFCSIIWLFVQHFCFFVRCFCSVLVFVQWFCFVRHFCFCPFLVIRFAFCLIPFLSVRCFLFDTMLYVHCILTDLLSVQCFCLFSAFL